MRFILFYFIFAPEPEKGRDLDRASRKLKLFPKKGSIFALLGSNGAGKTTVVE